MFKKLGSICLALCMFIALMIPTTVQAAMDKKPTKITLNYSKKEMSVGESFRLKVKTVKPAKASKNVSFTSSSKKLATVDKNGKVTAKKPGTVTITTKSKRNKKVVAKCKIKIYKATKNLKLTCEKSYVLNAGETQQLTAEVTNPKKGAAPIGWTSKNPKIAKVDAKGKVTAIKEGKTTITGKSGKKSVKVTIQVINTTTSTPESQEQQTPQIPQTPQTPESQEPEIYPTPTTITVAVAEQAYGVNMWKQVAEAFEKETGSKVTFMLDKDIEEDIELSISKGEYPDVIFLPTGRPDGLTEKFIANKMILDITDVFSKSVPGEQKKVSEKLLGGFTETSTTNPYNDGKTYLAPMFYTPTGLFYNQGLFEEKGWKVPTTWEEMWDLGKKAKSEGIALFTYPTTGYIDTFLYSLMYSAGGADFFNKATTYTTGLGNTPEAQKCFDIIEQLAAYTHEMTPVYANDVDFGKNQQMVLDNQALFMPNGTWIVKEMSNASRAEGFQWGMTAIPAVEAGGDRYAYSWSDQIWIPSQAKNQEVAKLFLAFLYSDVASEIFAKAGAIQPIFGMADYLNDDDKMFYSVYDQGAKFATGYFQSFEQIPESEISLSSVFFEPLNSVVRGSMGMEEWIQNMIASSNIIRANLKK